MAVLDTERASMRPRVFPAEDFNAMRFTSTGPRALQ